jgi:hypothetical protein
MAANSRYRHSAQGDDGDRMRRDAAEVCRLTDILDSLTPLSMDGLVVKASAAYGLACAGAAAPRSTGIEDQLAFSVLRDLRAAFAAGGPRFFIGTASSSRARRKSGIKPEATPAGTSR